MPGGRKRKAPAESTPLQPRQTRARTRSNHYQFVNPTRGRAASNVGTNRANQFVNNDLPSPSATEAASTSGTQTVSSRHRVVRNNTSSNRQRRRRVAFNVGNRQAPRSSGSVEDQHPIQPNSVGTEPEIQLAVSNDVPNAYGRQDQEQEIGPVNRMVNANELFQLQGEHGESNITSVANNVSDNIPSVNNHDIVVSSTNFPVSFINASTCDSVVNNFTSSGTSNTSTFSHNSGSNISSSSSTCVQNINTNGSSLRINALESSGTSLGLINTLGASGTYVSNINSVGFNSGINAFGTSGTSLPYINSRNTNSSFPITAHTTLGMNIPSSGFYASHSGALGNSVINNPVSNTANVFGPIAGANTSSFNMPTCLLTSMHAPNQIDSVCSPLSASVPQSLKEKIVKGEYIDLALLLEKVGKVNEPEDMKLTVDEKGCFVWKQNVTKRQISSVHVWTSAFLVFASVYLSVHPHRFQELLKYIHIIRSAASRVSGWGWRSYDIQFRLRQQQQPQRSWSLIDVELWALYIASSPVHNVAPSPQFEGVSQSGNFRGPAQKKGRIMPTQAMLLHQKMAANKQCFKFNRAGCDNKKCSFAHKCALCGESDHGSSKCKKGK